MAYRVKLSKQPFRIRIQSWKLFVCNFDGSKPTLYTRCLFRLRTIHSMFPRSTFSMSYVCKYGFFSLDSEHLASEHPSHKADASRNESDGIHALAVG